MCTQVILLVCLSVMSAGRLMVAQHALQVLDTGLLGSVSHTCHSAAECIQDHLHGSLLVLCCFFPGLYGLSSLCSHPKYTCRYI